jgi:hypothetical protein
VVEYKAGPTFNMSKSKRDNFDIAKQSPSRNYSCLLKVALTFTCPRHLGPSSACFVSLVIVTLELEKGLAWQNTTAPATPAGSNQPCRAKLLAAMHNLPHLCCTTQPGVCRRQKDTVDFLTTLSASSLGDVAKHSPPPQLPRPCYHYRFLTFS